MNLDDVLKGSKVPFCETVVIFDLRMMMIPCGRCSTSGASGSNFVAATVLCRPLSKSGRNLEKTAFDVFNVHFSWCVQCFVRSNMCSCNPLRTLSVSDRSCCGAVRILISLAPRNPLGTLCWSALVSALCVGRSVSHCFLLWFPTPHTVRFLLPEQFSGMYIL